MLPTNYFSEHVTYRISPKARKEKDVALFIYTFRKLEHRFLENAFNYAVVLQVL